MTDSQDDRPGSELSDDLFSSAGDAGDDAADHADNDAGQSDAPRRGASSRRRSRVPLVIGLCLILIGVGVLGWVGYQYIGTNVMAEQRFEDQKDRLRQEWDNPPADVGGEPNSDNQDPKAGGSDSDAKDARAIALLRIPRFGPDYEVPLIPGITDDVLESGVGIYDQAVAPGEIGNFSVAGHRITRGEPFRRLLEIQKGDEIIVETRDAIFTYVIDVPPSELTVDASEGWVLDPVPGKDGEEPSQSLITLTTCEDLFHSPDRSVGFGHLVDVQNK